ncbi:MAG: hypothetical protein Q9169_002639 [Polycauliona sp. 2 TL-2023]
MLHLHIWGPAFTLPSIDPQCLAAIAYLSRAVPPSQWNLIASSDPTLSPTRELPVLQHDENWIAGFQNIVAYLAQVSEGKWNLDRDCSLQEKADITAYTSFLSTHFHPLIDLTLYVSSENYHAATRPAYAHILHWPNTWLIPPQRRAATKARTEHLGVSGLDLDTADNQAETKTQFGSEAEIPKRFIGAKGARTTLAKKKGQHAARFRLEGLVDGCLGPLNDLLDGKNNFFSSGEGDWERGKMTSLDCLALAYLSLAVIPDLPQAWLAQKMKKEYPDLCRFVEEHGKRCFGMDVRVRSMDRSQDDYTTDSTTTQTTMKTLTYNPSIPSLILPLFSSLPFFGHFYRPPPLLPSTSTSSSSSSSTPSSQLSTPPSSLLHSNTHNHNHIPILPSLFLALLTSTTAFGAYFLATGETPTFEWVRGIRQRHRVGLGWMFGRGGGKGMGGGGGKGEGWLRGVDLGRV